MDLPDAFLRSNPDVRVYPVGVPDHEAPEGPHAPAVCVPPFHGVPFDRESVEIFSHDSPFFNAAQDSRAAVSHFLQTCRRLCPMKFTEQQTQSQK